MPVSADCPTAFAEEKWVGVGVRQSYLARFWTEIGADISAEDGESPVSITACSDISLSLLTVTIMQCTGYREMHAEADTALHQPPLWRTSRSFAFSLITDGQLTRLMRPQL